jgi:hypothetical protein
MASKPKGKKGRVSYSNESQAPVSTTDAGPSNVKDTTSQVATSGTQDPEWMTLRSGTRLEQKEMMETSLGLILEATDVAIATSSEVETKKEDANTFRDYMCKCGRCDRRPHADMSSSMLYSALSRYMSDP